MLTSSMFRGRTPTLFAAALLLALIALADWKVDAEVPLGILYLLPMVMAGGVLRRSGIALMAAVCTVLAEAFDSFRWSLRAGIPRDALYFAAFCGVGLFVYEVASRRKSASVHLQEVEGEIQARRDAEEQLQILVESSPIAIFTADEDGIILLANDAAHRLLAAPPHGLSGAPVSRYLPSLRSVPALRAGRQVFRTVMQCRGHRQDGEVFIAEVWFSTYRTSAGSRLAAMVVDASDELRDREEAGLHQLLAGSRILVGAVSHEVRNVCGAIALVHENLARCGTLSDNKDFQALGTLVLALEKIAAMDLRQTANQAGSVDLPALLEELQIVIGPALREHAIELRLEVAPGLPAVWADRQSLMQVFLNLTKNSSRAMAEEPLRRLTLRGRADGRQVFISFEDTGSGVAHPELLFRPFQHRSREAGLGLYLSRALMRSFGGDLRFEPGAAGATFIVEMPAVPGERAGELHHEMKETYASEDPAFADRRP